MRILLGIKSSSLILTLLTFFSCSKNDEYVPMVASVMHNGVLISCKSTSGEDMLAKKDFVDRLSIYGVQSKKNIKYQINKFTIGTSESYFISFNAETPNASDMKMANGSQAEGVSVMCLKYDKQDVKLQCDFIYESSGETADLLGNSLIRIEKIECNGKSVNRNETNVFDSNIILNYIFEDDKLDLE